VVVIVIVTMTMQVVNIVFRDCSSHLSRVPAASPLLWILRVTWAFADGSDFEWFFAIFEFEVLTAFAGEVAFLL
jgi:hypothetical protein